jgi:glycosyltransferase involved in cell wall biosynthesis
MRYEEIISYCCGAYEKGNFGGVARYDHTLSKVFPERKFFKGPDEKRKMLDYLRRCKNPVVLADNHLSCDVPNEYPVFILHHGCALTTSGRNPDWEEPWKSLCTNGQKKMIEYRDPKKTTMVSTSKSCRVDFEHYFGKKYTRFRIIDLLNTSELDESRQKNGKFNDRPIVLGNWGHVKKGSRVMPRVMKDLRKDFDFRQLKISPSGKSEKEITDFNKKKQDIYLECDIFLQISSSEGNAFSSLDAMLCGMAVVSTDVGKFYGDVPEDCFVKMDWRRQDDPRYVKKCLEQAWSNREKLGEKAREWYMNTSKMEIFKQKWNEILS